MTPNLSGQAPTSPSQTPRAPDRASRTYLFGATFWQVLPAHYDKIITRWELIARLYHEASAAVMATDRAAGINSLKAEVEMLEGDISTYRGIVNGVESDELVGIYLVAGRQRWRAEQIAKEDMEDMEKSLMVVERKISDMKADMVYGFEKQ